MKKTYITTMPNHIGAFLKASECFAALGVNITRVSYNKAVDSHTLFIDAEGSEGQLRAADDQLARIGYLQTPNNDKGIVLVEFHLKDVPGSVTEVLRIISEYRLNISYISSQENGSAYQAFKMGLFVEDEDVLKAFLARTETLCPVRVIDYNHSEKIYDNSIFYRSFVSGLMQTLELPEDCRDGLLVNSNLVMQMLDEKGLSPYKTFESISRFAELLSVCRGDAFSPRITQHRITENTQITLIEPPCGSNTAILQSGGEVLFIDCGYALYRHFAEAADWEGALREIEPYVVRFPDANLVKIAYANALARSGRHEKAVTYLKGITILPSENGDDALAAWVYAWRGIALDALACGNKAAAKKAVEKALSFPENLGRGKPYDPPGRGTPEKPGLLADWPDSLMELL